MAWVEAASMSHSRAFHQILPRSASAVLAIGGLESNQTCHKSIEEFETTTGVWTDLGDLLLEARAEFCAVESKDKFYIVGGFRYNNHHNINKVKRPSGYNRLNF